KFQDGKRDDRSVVQGHMAAYFQDAYEALKGKYPKQTSGVEKALEAIWKLEDGGSTDIDALCRLSGEMLGSTFVPREDVFAPVLQRVGEGLGQFVYLMDAYEDRKADKRKGRFNPLLTMPEDTLEDVVEYGLTTMMESACSAFRLLPLEKDLDLLENVLYSGVWNRYVFIRENRKKKDGKEGEADEGSV
ncbi:MAG: hypothetical protein IJ865_06665, partial [Clostridia bacterium]|nr:hypothetical protein [Clostridia bacterium]